MPTTRSHFSFEQFEKVFQKMAHQIALDAVKTLKQGRTRIIIRENGTFSEVETDQHWFKFYANHLSYQKKSRKWAEHFGFEVEKKIYLTSNHSTKISFYSPEEEKTGQMKERIMEFIDNIMVEASIKPVPRFTLSKYTDGQRYLDLTNKMASKSA